MAPSTNNQNKLCCCHYRSHHHFMFLEDKGNISSYISSMQKHLSKTWRNMIRNKTIHPMMYFDLDPPIFATYWFFLIFYRLRWDLRALFHLGLSHMFSSYSSGPSNLFLIWPGRHLCFFIKRAPPNAMEFTLHNKDIFKMIRISNV